MVRCVVEYDLPKSICTHIHICKYVTANSIYIYIYILYIRHVFDCVHHMSTCLCCIAVSFFCIVHELFKQSNAQVAGRPSAGSSLRMKEQYILLWMDKILHHFETIGNHCSLVFTGESSFQVFFRWCRILSIHSMGVLKRGFPQNRGLYFGFLHIPSIIKPKVGSLKKETDPYGLTCAKTKLRRGQTKFRALRFGHPKAN